MIRAKLAKLHDNDLVLRVAGGDVRAFEAIYDRYSTQVYSHALRVTGGRAAAAEEATQDAFLSLWRSAHSYDSSRGAFLGWLLSMAPYRTIDWLRRETRHEHDLELDEPIVERLPSAVCTEEEVIGRDQAHHARSLLADLPSEQRQVIELAYFGGLTQTEIALQVHVPLGTVKGRQRLALTKLRRLLTSPPTVALTG